MNSPQPSDTTGYDHCPQVEQSLSHLQQSLSAHCRSAAQRLGQALAGADPGDSTDPPPWTDHNSPELQAMCAAFHLAARHWTQEHQAAIAALLAAATIAWAGAATTRHRESHPDQLLKQDIIQEIEHPTLLHHTRMSDPQLLPNIARRIARNLERNNPRLVQHDLQSLRYRVTQSLQQEKDTISRRRALDHPSHISRQQVARDSAEASAAFITALWDIDANLLLELDDTPNQHPDTVSSWTASSTRRPALEKIQGAFNTASNPLTPGGQDNLATTIAHQLALPTRQATLDTPLADQAAEQEHNTAAALLDNDREALLAAATALNRLQDLLHDLR